ncbi:hypothetical protein [Lysinibacillus sp. F5]|uniref:hypothetical protein n=1 Tax=Lysinibacillus sp. F5 TaxID=1700846 RepID=UPI000738B965|nr:hypothetical protein [Lysinibacillus sp. F5]KUF29966.1 hypothetical protein AK833_18035 [Lysinibacillus sp. F5]
MNFTLTIQAPGLEKALNNLASALQGNNLVNSASVVSEPQTMPQQQVMPEQIQQPAAVPTSMPPVQQPMPQQPVPTTQTAYSMDQLAVAATQLMDAGKRDQLMQLLASFGVQALTALPQEQYGAFATKLRELGANI